MDAVEETTTQPKTKPSDYHEFLPLERILYLYFAVLKSHL